MTSKTFVPGTVIDSPWLNDVNQSTYVTVPANTTAIAPLIGLSTNLANTSDMTKGVALVGGAARVVASIAALRTLPKTGSPEVFVTGYYTQGDGGGGAYWYDSIDTTTADNGGTVIVASDGGRWKLVPGPSINVKQFGAKGDGVADDTASIQAAFDYVANLQKAEITAKQLTTGAIHFPAGVYKLSNAIAARGFISITGEGVGGYGSSVLHQTVAATNIFNFYDNLNGGGCSYGIQGLNFEFDSSLATQTGIALNFPRLNDIGGGVISSNSHYIKNNRFFGWHAKGLGIFMATCNDVEITGNTFDVCSGGSTIIFGDQTYAGPSDVRMTQNEFYGCITAIEMRSINSATIHGNTFSAQFNGSGWQAILMASNTGTISPGTISNVVIDSNSFFEQYVCLEFDSTPVNLTYTNNTHMRCWNSPLRGPAMATNTSRFDIRGNLFHLDATYPNTWGLLGFVGGGKLLDSTIADNIIDANGVNAVVSVCSDSGSLSYIGNGCVYRNNLIRNNTSYPGRNTTYIPVSCRELVLENYYHIASSGLPTALNILNFNPVNVGDWFTFFLDWEVTLNKTSVNESVRVGTTKISVARLTGTNVFDATLISSVATDLTASGSASWPVVTWSVTNSSPGYLQLTVTNGGGGGVTAPLDTTVVVKAYGFRAASSCSTSVSSS